MRKTKKMIAMEEELERNILINSISCRNLVMQKLGLEVNSDGYVMYTDEDTYECEVLSFDGKKCTMNLRDETTELLFDPYNNIKLACSLLYFYIERYLGFEKYGEILLLYLSNDKLINRIGHCVLKFIGGFILEGNDYYRDTLKYIDAIYILDGSAPIEFSMLRGIDVNDTINR